MSPTLENFQVFLRECNEALTPWHCIFQCEGGCSHSCQRIRQSLHPIGTVTHSRLRTQSLSAWDLQMGIWTTWNKLLLMAGEQTGRPKNSFFNPILHTLNNGRVNGAAWCPETSGHLRGSDVVSSPCWTCRLFRLQHPDFPQAYWTLQVVIDRSRWYLYDYESLLCVLFSGRHRS